MKTITMLKVGFLAGIIALMSGCGTMKAAGNLEEGAWGTFNEIWDRWVESEGDIGWAVVWHRKVEEGVELQDILDALDNVAMNAPGLMDVGHLPLSEELNARGVESGVIHVVSYCNPATARKMIDFSPAMGAFLPCRVTIVEQEDGLHLYTMNMDMMIKMGKKMPEELKELTMAIREAMWEMMEKGATGDVF
ncbi:DUF302 domain-containing protein [Thiomicrospira sp. R3]|uniref:DUF302 domain-containing protein n=1 Tax=Thiomicrospira sp. R3 TaxID=3035472 RepID=UPI00259B6DE8|nr:DUF302 domain-containing protein [Thiomicrospira sp. R3]WFE68576.1 DUF302 domain-containing protein [Thiomicrospira sp. R3]